MSRTSPDTTAFTPRPTPAPRSAWKRWLHIADPVAAAVAIENLLASRQPADIWPAEVSQIATAYGLGGRHVRSIALALWQKAVAAAVADDQITEEESQALAALRRVLQICEDEAIAVERKVIHPRFQKAVAEALADWFLSPAERQYLDVLSDGLRLSKAELSLLYGPTARSIVEEKFAEVVADRRVSPDELVQLGQIADNLGVSISLEPDTDATVRRYAEYWKIENGDFPHVDVPLRLQAGEVCYFQAPAEWQELRTVTRRSNAGSIGYSVRIAKGVYYRSPRVQLPSVKEEVLTPLDTGHLYITNKRVLFDGGRKNSTFKLSSLLGFQPYTDGFALEKSSGRNPILIVNGDVELSQVVLGAALARA